MPESEDLLGSAASLLETAEDIADKHPASAAREAYLAALNAARAVIFEKLQRSTKTHSGARATFHRLVHDGMEFPKALLDFLEDGFRLKTDADYGTRKLADAQAAHAAVETAAAFVARCAEIVRGR